MARTPERLKKSSLRDYLSRGAERVAAGAQSAANRLKGTTVRGASEVVGEGLGRAARGAVNVGAATAKTAGEVGGALGAGARRGFRQARSTAASSAPSGVDVAAQTAEAVGTAAGAPNAPGTAGTKSRFQTLRDKILGRKPAAAAKLSLLRRGLRAAGRGAVVLGAVPEALDVAAVAADDKSSGLDVATQVAEGAGRLGAAGTGAAIGAGIGSVVPVVGTAVGGIAGGLAGFLGADKLIKGVRAERGITPESPVDRIEKRQVQSIGQILGIEDDANLKSVRDSFNPDKNRPAAETVARGLRGRAIPLGNTTTQPVVQVAPNSFTNVPQDQAPTDIGKPGGGLSIVGSLTPERAEAISRSNAALQEAREAASLGISTERYRRIKQNRQLAAQVQALGLRGRAGAADLVTEASGSADTPKLSDLISLARLQQQGEFQDASLGLRGAQLGVNRQIAEDERAASERIATARLIEQLNDPDPGVASAARGQLLQAFENDPSSPEGRLLLSQTLQELKQKSGEERGLLDFFAGSPEFPADLSQGGFTIEDNIFGQPIVKDSEGRVLGNLDDLRPEHAQAVRRALAKRGAK